LAKDKKKETSIYYDEPVIIEVQLINGQLVPIPTGRKPQQIEKYGINLLRIVDENNTVIELRTESIIFIRTYSKTTYSRLLSYGSSKKKEMKINDEG